MEVDVNIEPAPADANAQEETVNPLLERGVETEPVPVISDTPVMAVNPLERGEETETVPVDEEHRVIDVTPKNDANHIAELKEEISHLQVEISFMHGENDNIRKEYKVKLAELTEGYEEKIRAHEETNDQLRKEISALRIKYDSKCNDAKTLEVAQNNFESILQNKDEIIESQKLIIGGVRKKISETDALKSKSTIRNLERTEMNYCKQSNVKMKNSRNILP